MHPVLFKIGPLTLYTYGAMLAFAFIAGVLLAEKRAVKAGIPAHKIVDLSLCILISSLVGARLFFVFINWEYYGANPGQIFRIWEGGLVFYGGFIVAFLAAVFFLRINNLPVWKTADIFAPSFALGIGIGRIGCFLNGCCWGKISREFGICFPAREQSPIFTHQVQTGLIPSDAAYSLPVIPTQLFSSVFAFIIFLVILRMEKNKKFDGFIWWMFILFYSIGRFIIENFRYYESNFVLWPGFTVSQWISVFFALAAAVFLVRLFKKDRAQKS